jgi:hypothetical protein
MVRIAPGITMMILAPLDELIAELSKERET